MLPTHAGVTPCSAMHVRPDSHLPSCGNFRSRGLIFLLQNKGRTESTWLCFTCWRNAAIRLSKSISKPCTAAFEALRKALRPALPKAPEQPGTARRELRMSAHSAYLLISYYITEKEKIKKNKKNTTNKKLSTRPKRKRKGKL